VFTFPYHFVHFGLIDGLTYLFILFTINFHVAEQYDHAAVETNALDDLLQWTEIKPSLGVVV